MACSAINFFQKLLEACPGRFENKMQRAERSLYYVLASEGDAAVCSSKCSGWARPSAGTPSPVSPGPGLRHLRSRSDTPLPFESRRKPNFWLAPRSIFFKNCSRLVPGVLRTKCKERSEACTTYWRAKAMQQFVHQNARDGLAPRQGLRLLSLRGRGFVIFAHAQIGLCPSSPDASQTFGLLRDQFFSKIARGGTRTRTGLLPRDFKSVRIQNLSIYLNIYQFQNQVVASLNVLHKADRN